MATNTTTSTATSANTTTSTSQNILTSQQSARVFGGFALPWRTTHWNHSNDSFILGPVLKSGFDTLVNPTTPTNATGTSSGTVTATTAQFQSVYWFNAIGFRTGWSQFPQSTDKAPIPLAQIDLTIGQYSNLASYVCQEDPKKLKNYPPVTTTAPTVPAKTSCYIPTPNSNPVTYTQYQTTRTLIPRIEIAGSLRLPNYPFVIGVDANLAQYAFGSHLKQIDTLNKPGNDVSLYFGIVIDPRTAFKNLGVAK